jgi:hypothetical protein
MDKVTTDSLAIDEHNVHGFVSLTDGETAVLTSAAPTRGPSSGEYTDAVKFVKVSENMPDLEDLLNQSRVSYAILEREPRPTVALGSRERLAWAVLAVFGCLWSVLTSFSLLRNSYWLAPNAALFGLLGIAVLGATLWTWGAQNHAPGGSRRAVGGGLKR